MPDLDGTFNFDALIGELTSGRSRVGRDDLSIWGGEFESASLEIFWQAFSDLISELPWGILEYVDKVQLKTGADAAALPGHHDRLNRVRLFGEGGDLSVRRDGWTFRWFFVGPSNAARPSIDLLDFWDHQDPDFFMVAADDQMMLWGEKNQETGQWTSDKVGGYSLDYPVFDGSARVLIKYRAYSSGGQLQFVWLTGLEGGATSDRQD
jgi:hypothetical protein